MDSRLRGNDWVSWIQDSAGMTGFLRSLLITRWPVAQKMLADAVLQAQAVDFERADEKVAGVARIDHVLRLKEFGEAPRRSVALDFGLELSEALRIVLEFHAVEHVDRDCRVHEAQV